MDTPSAPETPGTGRSTPPPAQQAVLPFDDAAGADADRVAVQGGDPDHERPIGFALTARARRAVAPATLPALRVVADHRRGGAAEPADGALEEPGDTRPARARALRRAGVPVTEIARQLGTDTLAVAAWVGEVAPRSHRARGSRTPEPAGGAGGPADAAGPPPAVAPGGGADAATAAAERQEEELAHHLARAAAAEQARQRLDHDAGFALGVGILASLAEIDQHAITLTAAGPQLVARALEVLVAEAADVRDRVRVIVRVGPEAAGDLVRHRTATALGLDPAQVTWTRWRGAARPDAIQLLARVADPDLAATVGGWVDTALDPVPTPATAWHA